MANWRKTWILVGKWAFAALFVLGGVGHVVATDFYVKTMPPFAPGATLMIRPAILPRIPTT